MRVGRKGAGDSTWLGRANTPRLIWSTGQLVHLLPFIRLLLLLSPSLSSSISWSLFHPQDELASRAPSRGGSPRECRRAAEFAGARRPRRRGPRRRLAQRALRRRAAVTSLVSPSRWTSFSLGRVLGHGLQLCGEVPRASFRSRPSETECGDEGTSVRANERSATNASDTHACSCRSTLS